jgi:RNA polymerase sigma-70 factor (ECF subfamily)
MQATVMQVDNRTMAADTPDLVRQAQGGDVEAFEALYREHVGRVYGLCLRISANPALAEELTQETFIRAWTRLDTFQLGTRFAAWLSKVAVNVALGDRRSRGRRSQKETPVDDPDRWDPPAPRTTPSEGMDLEKAIAGLPEGARRVFVLYDIEGFQHNEIAHKLGLSSGTSKAQLHRARRLLREALTS